MPLQEATAQQLPCCCAALPLMILAFLTDHIVAATG
jgi:hypothetical protein